MDARAYFDSDALQMQSQVCACLLNPDGGYDVYLQQTLFHPQGGGQPADIGTIQGLPVSAVRQTEQGIAHTLAHALPLGPVTLQIDAERRSWHARLHSAGHLLASVAEHYGWLATKGHHWPGEARVVLQAQADAQVLQAQPLALAVNQQVRYALSRKITYEQGQRHIAFEGFPARRCGGTHVSNSLEIGQISITKIKLKQEQLTISYDVLSVSSDC